MALDQATLVQFLDDELGVDPDDVTPTAPLFSSGLLDSFLMVQLLAFIEGEAGIRIPPGDVNLDNLDSIERILAYVDRATSEA